MRILRSECANYNAGIKAVVCHHGTGRVRADIRSGFRRNMPPSKFRPGMNSSTHPKPTLSLPSYARTMTTTSERSFPHSLEVQGLECYWAREFVHTDSSVSMSLLPGISECWASTYFENFQISCMVCEPLLLYGRPRGLHPPRFHVATMWTHVASMSTLRWTTPIVILVLASALETGVAHTFLSSLDRWRLWCSRSELIASTIPCGLCICLNCSPTNQFPFSHQCFAPLWSRISRFPTANIKSKLQNNHAL